jgi:hypothetical protein
MLYCPDVDDFRDKDMAFNSFTMLLGTRVGNEEYFK